MVTGGIIASFIFGLIFGSFLNVVILRWDDWMSILVSRSACPQCKQQLRWYDLIPLISFVTLAGRCRYCQKPISWQYPVVELSTALLVALGYQFFFPATDPTIAIVGFVAFIVAVGALVAIFFHDIYEMLVPDLLAYILLFSAVVLGVAVHGWEGALYGLLVGFLPIALLVYPSKGHWMGEGDVKIAAALGAVTGYPGAIAYIALAFLLGGFYGAVILISRKAKVGTAVPFAPFLIIAGLIAFFWGQDIVSWYLGVFGYAF